MYLTVNLVLYCNSIFICQVPTSKRYYTLYKERKDKQDHSYHQEIYDLEKRLDSTQIDYNSQKIKEIRKREPKKREIMLSSVRGIYKGWR